MKKTLIYVCMAVTAAFAAVSCDINSFPVFDDATDAFVKFDNDEATVVKGETINVGVTLASVAGLEATATFTVAPVGEGGAVEGVDYTILNSGKTLSFNAQNRTAYIQIQATAGTVGEKAFIITVTGNEPINTGAQNTCEVEIVDAD